MSNMAPQSNLQSSMCFLKRDLLYNSEKVYEIRTKSLKSTVPRTNVDLEKIENIDIHNMRGIGPSIEEHGFCYVNMKTNLQPEDFLDRSKIINDYLPQLTRAVKASLGADRVQIYDFIVPLNPRYSFKQKLRSCSAVNDIQAFPTDMVTSMESRSPLFQST